MAISPDNDGHKPDHGRANYGYIKANTHKGVRPQTAPKPQGVRPQTVPNEFIYTPYP